MIWTYVNRRNIVYLGFVLALLSIGALYSINRVLAEKIETLQGNISNLTERNTQLQINIRQLNTTVENLKKDNDLLNKTNTEINKELANAVQEDTQIVKDLDTQSSFILGDTTSYNLSDLDSSNLTLDQSTKQKDTTTKVTKPSKSISKISTPKELNSKAKDTLSEIRIDALWKGYCQTYQCGK